MGSLGLTPARLAEELMVSYFARSVVVGVRARLNGSLGPYDGFRQDFRAWPRYCDQNLHINNAHFLTFMDYGRIAWMVRIGLWDTLGPSRRALVGGLGITYRREVRLLTRFELHTQLAASDERWMYFAQEFKQDAVTSASAIVRVCIRDSRGFVVPEDLLGCPSPAMPEAIRLWRDGVDASRRASS